MAIPTIPQKRLLAAGARRTTTWGTALALGANYGMLIESDGGLVRNQAYLPAKEADTPFVLEGDLGVIDPVDFAPEFTMRYDPGALGILISQLFVGAGAPTLSGGGYTHKFRWLTNNYAEMATFAVERASKIFEVPSVKTHMLDFNIADGFLKGTIGLRGNTVINNSGINDYTQMDAITYKDRGNRVKFSQLSAFMIDQSTASQPDVDPALELSDISMHFERPHDSPHKAGSQSIIEPMENAPSIVTLTMTFPRMSTVNNAYFAEFIAETEKKAYIRFDGAVISGQTASYMLRFYFPRLRIINIEYPFDDIVPATITLQAEEAASTPTGFLYNVPYLYLINTRSGDYIEQT